MSTPINIIINNQTVLDDLESVNIVLQEEAFCNTVSLALKSKNFWSLCNPVTDFGTLRIQVVIGAVTYEFLAEERDTTPSLEGMGFTIWGRSKQALLGRPYSRTITDTDSTSHPWQIGDTTADLIVAYVVSNYCDYSVTVDWNVSNFVVYKDSFSVSGQTPIDVISSLAAVVGAELKANVDGSLSVETYSVAEGSSVQSYTSRDDIISLSERVEYPSGYNAVTVYGYDPESAKKNAYISAERIAAYSGDEMGAIYPNSTHMVRVYYSNADDLTPLAYGDYAPSTVSFSGLIAAAWGYNVARSVASGTETITEDVELTFGHGNTSMPMEDGTTEVTGDETKPLDTVTQTYTIKYEDFLISGVTIPAGEDSHSYTIMFYFEDKSAYTTYSFTVSERDSDSSGLCGSIVVEKASPTTVVKGSKVIIRVYGSSQRATGFDSAGGSTSYKGSGSDWYEESVIFYSGVATTTYPVASDDIGASSYISATWAAQLYYMMTLAITKGSNQVTLKPAVGGTGRYYAIAGNLTYLRYWREYEATVPSDYDNDTFVVTIDIPGCSQKSVSMSVTEIGKKDITLNVSNWSSATNVDEVDVEVDGAWVGKTDGNGNILLNGVAVGDHTVKLTKSGYLASDLDDIENSSFTVE